MAEEAGLNSALLADMAAEHLRAGRCLRGSACGLSMWPLIRTGQPLEVRAYAAGDRPRVGDVVLVDRGVKLVLHRIVGIRGATTVTKGDAVGHRDGAVEIDKILGRIQRHPLDAVAATLSPWTGPVLEWAMHLARRVLRGR